MTNVATRFQPDISGSAVPAGYIGERKTWVTPPSSNNSVTTTESDWTNASIDLGPGIWHVIANLSYLVGTSGSAESACSLVVKITDSSNNVVQGMVRSLGISSNPASVMNVSPSTSMSFVANLSASSTVYKIRVQKTETNGTGLARIYNNSGAQSSDFYAIRIG